MSSANRNILTISLSICTPFISSSGLIVLARNSRTMLNKSGDSGHTCLLPEFRGNGFSFSQLIMMLTIGLSYIPFRKLRYIPSIPSFCRTFIMKWCWILLKAFSAPIEMIKWFLSFLLLMCCITLMDLHMLNYICIPGMKSTWS
jgi:hypothetical protein